MSESPQQADDDQIEIPNKEGVLALSLIKGRLGLASFDPSTNEIGFAEVADCDVFALLAMFIQELQPTQIIIPQNASVELVEALSRDCIYHYLASCIGYKTIRTPPHTFSEDVARRYISMIRAGNHPCTRADRIVGQAANLQLVFDFRKQQMSRAMGALMSYLHKFPSMGADMNISQGIINVDSFRSINLQNIVRMEGSAFKGLEIFEREKHPSMHGTGITKEGMSIFSLIGSASLHSSKGIRMMRQWFNRPLCDIHLIKQRQDTVECFAKLIWNEEIQIRGSKKGGIIHSIQHSLGSVRPLESIFLVLQRGEGRRTTFESLVKILLHSHLIIEAIDKAFKEGNFNSIMINNNNINQKIIPQDLPLFTELGLFPRDFLIQISEELFKSLILQKDGQEEEDNDQEEKEGQQNDQEISDDEPQLINNKNNKQQNRIIYQGVMKQDKTNQINERKRQQYQEIGEDMDDEDEDWEEQIYKQGIKDDLLSSNNSQTHVNIKDNNYYQIKFQQQNQEYQLESNNDYESDDEYKEEDEQIYGIQNKRIENIVNVNRINQRKNLSIYKNIKSKKGKDVNNNHDMWNMIKGDDSLIENKTNNNESKQQSRINLLDLFVGGKTKSKKQKKNYDDQQQIGIVGAKKRKRNKMKGETEFDEFINKYKKTENIDKGKENDDNEEEDSNFRIQNRNDLNRKRKRLESPSVSSERMNETRIPSSLKEKVEIIDKNQYINNTQKKKGTFDNENVHIRRGVDEKLDKLRDNFRSLGGLMSQIASEEIDTIPHDLIKRLSIAFFPNLGYLMAIQEEDIVPLQSFIQQNGKDGIVAFVGEKKEISKQKAQEKERRIRKIKRDEDDDYNEDEFKLDNSDFEDDQDENDVKDRQSILLQLEEKCKIQFQFQLENVRYYKNERMKGLDLQVGDIPEQIADLERVIIQRVASSVLDNAQILLRAVELVAEIDCFLTFALAAIEYSLVRPTLHNYSIINIKQGRNLIQELLSYSFVPNDTVLGEKQKSLKELKEKQMNIEMEQEQEKDMIESRIEQWQNKKNGREKILLRNKDENNNEQKRILILTGPNASGKSVYLKQVAQIVFLAHIGCYVPAESAEIGLVDSIFCRLVTHESAQTPLSCFLLDSLQMSSMIQQATQRSLLIIDEYGKGTSHIDGLSLLSATINHFINLNNGEQINIDNKDQYRSKCPIILLNTHMHDVLDMGDIPSSPCIQFCSMEYKVIKNKQNNKKRGNQFSGSGINTSSIVSSLQQSHSSSMQTLPPHKLESLDDDVIFTYRLIPGRSNVSLSLFCARRAGIPKHIVLRAAEVSSYFTSGHNTIPQMNFLTTKRINNLPFTSRDSGVQQDRYIQAAELFTQLSEEGSSAETILSALQRI